MKKLLLIFFGIFSFHVTTLMAADPVRYVQISTKAVSRQLGGFNVSSGTVQSLAVSSITVSTMDVSGQSSFIGPMTSTNNANTFNSANSTFNTVNTNIIKSSGVTNAILSTTGMAIRGDTSSVPGPNGFVGEIFSTTTANKAHLGSGTFGDFVSTNVTTGDWDLTLCYAQVANSATSIVLSVGISTAAGNTEGGMTPGNNELQNIPGAVNGVSQSNGCIFWAYTSTGTMTLYGKYGGTYATATPNMAGTLRARRAR